MPDYVAAIDQGTTSTRFMIFDRGGNVVAVDQREHEQLYPRPGWVEHDPLEILERTQAVMAGAFEKSGVGPRQIAAIGITNQRETAVVWQDTRTDAICNELARDGGADRFRARTGLPLATYFSGPKLKWILDNVTGARARAQAGELLFGNIDTWLIWNL